MCCHYAGTGCELRERFCFALHFHQLILLVAHVSGGSLTKIAYYSTVPYRKVLYKDQKNIQGKVCYFHIIFDRTSTSARNVLEFIFIQEMTCFSYSFFYRMKQQSMKYPREDACTL